MNLADTMKYDLEERKVKCVRLGGVVAIITVNCNPIYAGYGRERNCVCVELECV